jgi:hypothetical protein
MKNWKTTSAGIIMIAGGIVRLAFAIKAGNFTEEAIMTSVTAITGGIGLLLAKDNDVTGGKVAQ